MVLQNLPHPTFNLVAFIVSLLVFFWGWGAFTRFYRVLTFRLAVLTDNTVMIRGMGHTLKEFSGAMPSHARSILHTRNVDSRKEVKFLYVPFHVMNIVGKSIHHDEVVDDSSSRLSIPVISASKDEAKENRHESEWASSYLGSSFFQHHDHPCKVVPKPTAQACGFIPIWCANDCTILVLYGLDIDKLKRFFKHSIKANRLFAKGSKYRVPPSNEGGKKQKECLKGHVYAQRLVNLFTKKELCTAYSDEINEAPNMASHHHGDRFGRVYEVPIYDTSRGMDESSKASALREVDIQHTDQRAQPPKRKRADNTQERRGAFRLDLLREYSGDNRALRNSQEHEIVSSSTNPSTSPQRQSIGVLIIPQDLPYIEEPENIPLGGDRGRNTSNHSCDIEMGVAPKDSRTFPRSPVDRSKYTSLDFGLQVLDPVPQSRLTESDTMYNIGEMYIHASGALFTSNEVYGMESDDMPEKLALSSSPADDAGNECVICLTEVQQIFLLPCRHLCVCKDCFLHIDKCPVCRTPFEDFVSIQNEYLISWRAPKFFLDEFSTSKYGNGMCSTKSKDS